MAVRGLHGNDGTRETAGAKARSKSAVRPEQAQPSRNDAGEQSGVVVATRIATSSDSLVNERIAELRDQIQAGRYRVDSKKLAERLLDEELARAEQP